jgi:hypothetical protein
VPEVPAVGPLPLPPVPPVVTTPKDIVKVGDEIIGGPGQAPRPDLVAIAQELGRQEKKQESMLPKLSALELLPDIIDALADLLDLVDDFQPGTTYSVRQPCGTAAGGGPLPPVKVTVPDALGSTAAIVNRLDALADLIDIQKQLRGTVCKGKPSGQPVTVTFAEVDP